MLPCAARASLPVVKLYGTFGSAYSEGRIVVNATEQDSAVYAMQAKWRGSSSQSYTKKSYLVKLLDGEGSQLDASLMGMREDDAWILDAMAGDVSRMRNRVSFDLWNAFSRKPYYHNMDLETFNGTRGQFVEVYLNDSYHGIYCLTERIDRKQLRLRKKSRGVVRGVLYKATNWSGTGHWDYDATFDNTLSMWMGWESAYPDVSDDGDTDYAPLVNAAVFLCDASDSLFAAEVAQRFDLPVWEDFKILGSVIMGTDNQGKNLYEFAFDIVDSPMLCVAPWDMDISWGRGLQQQEMGYTDNFNTNLIYRLMQNSVFAQEIATRYATLRATTLHADSLKQRFNDYFDLFSATGAAERETARWDGVDDVHLDFAAEREYICQWIDKRLRFVDDFYGYCATGISDHKATPQRTGGRDVWYTLSGQRIPSDRAVGGIFIHNGKKVLR